MPSLSRRWIAIGALLGAIGVGLGAYSAHGLSNLLQNRFGYIDADLLHRLDVFETAVRYQMFHAAALVLVGLALSFRETPAWRFAAWAFLGGTIIFSGLLKVLAFAPPDFKWLGAIVPIGGLLLIIGWLALAAGALRK
jgi:uncharacterized membrane protein YgdD (TMEM256/DUF423 family)